MDGDGLTAVEVISQCGVITLGRVRRGWGDPPC